MLSSLPQAKTKPTQAPFITQVDEAILHAVNRYHLVTAEQLVPLIYGSKMITAMRSRLSHLADGAFLLRNTELRPLGPVVYSLGPKGRTYLQALGVPVPERLKKPVVNNYGYGHLKHALGVTDILLAADLLAKTDERIQVQGLLNEHALKRKGIRVALPDGQKETVCPDAWLDMRVQTDRRYRNCLAVEFDRGNEWQPAWRKKVRAILSWARGPYVTTFGTEVLTVAVIVDAGELSEQRVRNLLRWTEAELDLCGAKAEADLFRFAACAPATLSPAELFLHPLFVAPFNPVPTSLLVTTQGEA